jgi:hypothetical protein
MNSSDVCAGCGRPREEWHERNGYPANGLVFCERACALDGGALMPLYARPDEERCPGLTPGASAAGTLRHGPAQ